MNAEFNQEMLSVDKVTEILQCDKVTAADRLNRGVIPGLKFGRSWIIPAGAFFQRLNELALEEATKRREASEPQVSTPAPQGDAKTKKRGRTRFTGSGIVV